MSGTVLVAYATKYGSTREIAERIGAVLRQAGLKVDVVAAQHAAEVQAYSAVVLGSAVYAGQWRKEAIDYLKANEDDLRRMPVWLFSTGPTGQGDPLERMKGWRFPEHHRALAERVAPREIALFHGVIEIEKLSLAERLIIRGVHAPLGDYRDWEAITSWAQGIAEALQKEAGVSHA